MSLAGGGWGFWLMWVLATAIGWGVGGPVGVALSSSKNIIVTGYLGVALGGILAGALQWAVLRPQVNEAGWWVLASVAAAAVVGVLVFAIGALNVDVGWVLGVALLGAVVGVLQWLLLRGQFAHAGWWVVVSGVGWVVSGPVASTVGWVVGNPTSGVLGAAVVGGWLVLGGVFGGITGPVLVWLLRQ